MSKYFALKVAEKLEDDIQYDVTPKMIEEAPEFDSQEEATDYCNLINPDFVWVTGPK